MTEFLQVPVFFFFANRHIEIDGQEQIEFGALSSMNICDFESDYFDFVEE